MIRRWSLLGLLLLLSGCVAAPAGVLTGAPLPPLSSSPVARSPIPVPSATPVPPSAISSSAVTRLPIPAPSATPVPLPTSPPARSPIPTLSATPVPTDVPLRAVQGDLSDEVDALEDAMPGENSERFVVPTAAELLAMAELTNQLLAGKVGGAGRTASLNGYELLEYADGGDGEAQNLLLREITSGTKGWGLYVFRQGPAQGIVIEVPHPRSDAGTSRIALALYRVLAARALLIAGAHRQANQDGSADVAHSAQTAFESIHEVLVAAGPTLVIQVHGFSAQKHPGYPQVIVSSSQGSTDPLLESLAAALQQEGVRVGRCGGAEWGDLCGETNLQARHIGAGSFLHIEMDESIRADAGLLIAALQQALK